jgi:hypothetical protein
MRSVQPRAITYVAVQASLFLFHLVHLLTVELQLRFALSSCTFWSIKDDNFDYEVFYHNIVDWFELPPSATKAKETDTLLRWWNR